MENTLYKWRGAQIDKEIVFILILDTPTNGRFSNFDHVDFHACPEVLKTLKKQQKSVEVHFGRFNGHVLLFKIAKKYTKAPDAWFFKGKSFSFSKK